MELQFKVGDIVRLHLCNEGNVKCKQHDPFCIIIRIEPKSAYPYVIESLDRSVPILEFSIANIHQVCVKEEAFKDVWTKSR